MEPEKNPANVSHWADHTAEELIAQHPLKDRFVCASGISPSGVVHIGNFREVITVDFVVRALLDRKKKARFIYSWDDFDALRKIPKNMPDQEGLKDHLRKPISDIPDPFKQFDSYAGHFEKKFEAEIAELGIQPGFIYQNKNYRKGTYHEGIRHALLHQNEIRAILDRSRTEPLPQDWNCVTIYCESCNRDTTKLVSFAEPSLLKYSCQVCKKDFETDFSKGGGTKLLWRIDWPMRWAHEGVDFEPGGKDHSSTGGSYDTGKDIIREIWKKEPPYYVQYDFVLAKGIGSKLSSSSGELLTLGQALEVYEPQIIRYIFACRKPNLDFSIAFDLDVLKTYDDFDRSERYAFGVEEGEQKKVQYERRVYELCRIPHQNPGSYGKMPAQFALRHLCNILQIHQGNLDETRKQYRDVIKTDEDERRFFFRAKCAWKWITAYAPENFRFTLRTDDITPAKTIYPEAVSKLLTYLKACENHPPDEEMLGKQIFQIMKDTGLSAKEFFPEIYAILINQKNGPKLAPFILVVGLNKTSALLEKSLYS